MSNVKIEPGQMWEFSGVYYVVLEPHPRHKNGWRLFDISRPHDTDCWDYGHEIIRNFTLVA